MSNESRVPADAPAPVLLDNVKVVHDAPVEMIATEASVVLMAADMLMKVADGQTVMKREARAVEQQLRVAFEHNKLILTPIAREFADDLTAGNTDAAIEKLRAAEQAHD